MCKIQRYAFVIVSFILLSSISLAGDGKRVMVFGDSYAWGWIPVESIVPTSRYPANVRWPGVMVAELGDGYVVIEEALSGRTTNVDDPSLGIAGAGMNGAKYLPAAIASHQPLDLVVIMLGVNDTKEYLNRTTLEIALGTLQLADDVMTNSGVLTTYPPAQVLLVAPPPLGTVPKVDWIAEIFTEASVKKSQALGNQLGKLAEAAGIQFLDAGMVTKADGVDGLHLTPESHKSIGKAVARKVRSILETNGK